MKKFLLILTVSLVLVVGISYALTLVYQPNHNTKGDNIVFATTLTQNKEVQKRLKELGYYKGNVDGIIGSQTRGAVRSFQRDKGLVVDGVIGPKTLASLNITAPTQNSADIYVLAKFIHAEARGEPYVGQVAVGAVVLNRVSSPNFPNSIYGVIYQPYAFASVRGGQIRRIEPSETAYNAARDALNGWDPTHGSLYYYNPNTETGKWIWSRQQTATFGRHVFAV
jgi:N-acetylmuramoyl-L-alanine amidase